MRLHKFPWKRLLPLLFAIALLIWVGSTISIQSALATLAQLGPGEIILLAAINFVVLSTFVGRWWLLLRTLLRNPVGGGHAQNPVGNQNEGQRARQLPHTPYWRLLGYRITAFSISYFTPGAHFGGEPYQIYATTRWHKVPVPVSIAAVTLDKLLEMLINFAVLAAGVLALLTLSDAFAPWMERQLAIYATLLLAIPFTLLVTLWLGRHPLTATITRLSRLLRRPLSERHWALALHQSEDQAIWLCRTHPRVVGVAILVTLFTWVGVVGEFWLLTQMLGLSLSPLQAMTSLVAARIAILLPVPAGIGTLEAGQVLAMESLGVDPSVGIAIAVVIRARDVILGLIGLTLGGAHLWQHFTITERAADTTPTWPALPPSSISSSISAPISSEAITPISDVTHSTSPP